MKGKLGTLSLACLVGLTTVLVSGCAGTNNNGVSTKNAGRGNIITNNSAYRAGGFGIDGARTGYRTGLNDTQRTYGTTNGTNRTLGTGTNGWFGTNATNGTSGLLGTNNGINGNHTNGLFGRTGTTGIGTHGATGIGNTANGIHSMSASGSHVLQLGALTIVGLADGNGVTGTGTTGMGTASRGTAGELGQNWSSGTTHITGTTGTRPAGSRYSGLGGVGTYSADTGANGHTLTVTGRKAVEAIDRVNRSLSSPTSLGAKSDTLEKDLSYILKQVSTSGTR